MTRTMTVLTVRDVAPAVRLPTESAAYYVTLTNAAGDLLTVRTDSADGFESGTRHTVIVKPEDQP